MKVAALFGNWALETSAMTMLEESGVDILKFKSIGTLISGLRGENFDVAMIEDDSDQLANWLAMLQLHCDVPLRTIVVGTDAVDGLSRALLSGADDYVVLRENGDDLLARLRAHALLQQRRGATEQQLSVEGFSLDAETSVLRHEGNEVPLTPREFSLAWALFSNHGKVIRLGTLSAQVWGRAADISKRSIEQQVYKLRRKLATKAVKRLHIHAVHGVGYRLEIEEPVWGGPPMADPAACDQAL